MSKGAIAGLIIGFFALAARIVAQAPAAAEFEVVSIRPNTSRTGVMSITPAVGGRFTAKNVSLGVLIAMGYDVRTYQISGLPRWGWSENYDVIAKAPGNTGRPGISSMLQSMLAERFHLQLHIETRQMKGYALVADTHGAKLRSVQDEECQPSTRAPGAACGGFRISLSSLVGLSVDLNQLAAALGQQRDVGRPVVNKTGIAGLFDVQLKWSPVSGPQGRPAEVAPAEDALSIFKALWQN